MSVFAAEKQYNYESIHDSKKDKIVQFIEDFPYDIYNIYESDSFLYYLDPIKDRIKNKLRQGLIWEKNDLQIYLYLFTKPNTIAIDIGAHIGIHTMKLAKLVAPFGKVIAFEPQPKIFRELYMNLHLNGISNYELYHAAVSNQKGQIELTPLLEGNEGATSLINKGTGSLVDLLILDDLKLSNVSLIKIDVEGMEGYVLEGCKETIATNRPAILIEISGGVDFNLASPLERNKISKVIKQLENFSYQVRQIWGHEYLAIPSEKANIEGWSVALPASLRQQVFTTRKLLERHLTSLILRTYDELIQAWTGEFLRVNGKFRLNNLLKGIQLASQREIEKMGDGSSVLRSLKVAALLWNEGGIDDISILLNAISKDAIFFSDEVCLSTEKTEIDVVLGTDAIQLASQIQFLREWLDNASLGDKESANCFLIKCRHISDQFCGVHPKLEQLFLLTLSAAEKECRN